MNRKEFMERLRELLRDIPSEEREEALAYYESYFDEAGIEEESKVIRELESPEKVAKTIKEDLLGNLPTSPEKPEEETKKETEEEEAGSGRRRNTALLVVLLILTSPIWMALLGVLLGVVAAIFCGFFGVLAGLAGATIGILASGIALVWAGIGTCVTGQAAAGILILGVGLILAAVGILLLVCAVWLGVKVFPLICRGFVNLFQRLRFRKKEGVQ